MSAASPLYERPATQGVRSSRRHYDSTPSAGVRSLELSTIDTGERLLSEASQHIVENQAHAAVERLHTPLDEVREALPARSWRAFIQSARRHAIHAALMQDPFTRRAFRKPRGYAGDAATLDLIYGIGGLPRQTTCLGAQIYAATVTTALPQSVRYRRQLLARSIDETAARCSGARILSVACGHLREAELSVAIRSGAVELLFGIDQDSRSVSTVNTRFGGLRVNAETQSVKDVMIATPRHDKFDLVYAAGLYDYLSSRFAVLLTARLFGLLRSGGRLLIANLTSGDWQGYMECFMDWNLIYRTEDEVVALGAAIPESEIASLRTFLDPNRRIIYLEIARN